MLRCFCILFCYVLLSCTTKEKPHAAFKDGKQNLVEIDKIKIDQSLYPFSNFPPPIVNNPGRYFGIRDKRTCAIYLYSNKGEFVRRFSNQDNLGLEGCPHSFIIDDDVIHVFYIDERKIQKINITTGQFLGVTLLEFPENVMYNDFVGCRYDSSTGNYLIPSASDAGTFQDRIEALKNQKSISVFDKTGKMINEFGQTPSLFYEEYKYPTMFFYTVVSDNSGIYLKFALDNVTKKYSLDGKSVEDLEHPFPSFESNLRKTTHNDCYVGIAKEIGKGEEILYYHFMHLAGEGKVKNYLAKFNTKEGLYSEAELPNAMYSLFPYVKNDTISLLMSNSTSEEKYIQQYKFQYP